MTEELKIKILSNADSHTFEKLEDRFRDLLEQEGIEGEIEDSKTGNTTMTRKEEIGKKADKSARMTKEKELVYRINRLDKKGMRAALYSIGDMAILDEIVAIGENIEKITDKIGDKIKGDKHE